MIFRTQFLSESPPSIYTQLTATHTPPTDIWEFFWVSGRKKGTLLALKQRVTWQTSLCFRFESELMSLFGRLSALESTPFHFSICQGGFSSHFFPKLKKNTCTNLLGSEVRTAKKTTTAFILLSYQEYFFADLAWLSAESCLSTHVLQHFVINELVMANQFQGVIFQVHQCLAVYIKQYILL